MGFLDGIKSTLINTGMKFISVDEKIVRMFLETSSSNIRDIVILPASKIPMQSVVDKLENKKKQGYVYNGSLNGVEVSVIQTRMGAPQTAMIMECLQRCGVHAAIRIDFCGGLVKTGSSGTVKTGLDVGDIIIPNRIFLTDGTCMQYLQKYSSEIKTKEGIKSLEIIGYENAVYSSINDKYWTADVDKTLYSIFLDNSHRRTDILWSTDALFCEEKVFYNVWRHYDCNSVDMESAIIYLLGQVFDIPVISIVSISDLPDSDEYCMQTSNNFHTGLLTGLKKALSILLKKLPEIHKKLGGS